MLFNRYREISERCLELGEKIDILTHKEGEELRQLLEEQAWLSKTITRQVKDVLEEVREGLEYIENWINEEMEKVDKAAGDQGSPSDILELEEILQDAASIRDRARDLMLNRKDSSLRVNNDGQKGKGSKESAQIRIDLSQKDENAKKGEHSDPEIQYEVNSSRKEVAAASKKAADARSSVLPEFGLPEISRLANLKKTRDIINEDAITMLESKLSTTAISKPNINEKIYYASNQTSDNNSSKNKKRKKGRKKKNK